ncbi:hypothetical protein MTR67_044365, partial [Solanum verrucosum]
PGANLRGPEEDPNLGQASCQGSLQIALGGNRCASRPYSPKEQKSCSRCDHVANSTTSKFNSKNLQGIASRRGLAPRRK